MKSDIIGGTIAMIAAALSIFGVNVQKLSHTQEEARSKARPYHCRPLWWLGMSCVVLASFGDFFALGFAPQTLVASLGGGSTILGNCIMSRFWLRQSLFVTDILGVTMVTLGVVLLAAASEKEERYTMEEIYELMAAAPFILYCFCTTAFLMTLHLRAKRSIVPALRASTPSKNQDKDQDQDHNQTQTQNQDRIRLSQVLSTSMSEHEEGNERNVSSLSSPFPSPICDDPLCIFPPINLSAGKNKNYDDYKHETIKGHMNTQLPPQHIEKRTLIIDPKLPLYWAAISGTIGAQSVLLAKCVAELIFSSFSAGHQNQFQFFGTYALIGGMIFTVLLQTHTLNLATMSGDTISAYPVFQAFWITMSNISGVVFFQQVHRFDTSQWLMFPSSLLLVIGGIYLISKHEKYGNRIRYSVAMPIRLNSPRQHDIVAQSFVFKMLTPQKLSEESDIPSKEFASKLNECVAPTRPSPRKKMRELEYIV